MNVKLLLSLASTIVFAQAVLAGGSDPLQCPAPAKPAVEASYFYATGSIGYAQAPWDDIAGGTYGIATISFPKNANGGLTWGGNIGYQYRSWLGLELGALQLPKVTMKVTINSPGMPVTPGAISSYIIYLAAKLSHPLTHNLTLFSKFGIGYQNLTADKSLDQGDDGVHSNSNFGPFFAAGLAYQFMHNLSANLQFARATGQSIHGGHEDKFSTSPNFYTLDLQYSFK